MEELNDTQPLPHCLLLQGLKTCNRTIEREMLLVQLLQH